MSLEGVLNERELKIVRLREGGASFTSLGSVFEISPERARQIHRIAVKKLTAEAEHIEARRRVLDDARPSTPAAEFELSAAYMQFCAEAVAQQLDRPRDLSRVQAGCGICGRTGTFDWELRPDIVEHVEQWLKTRT